MCGLAGWFDLTGSKVPPLDLIVMWSLLEERGSDASGAMWDDKKGGGLWVFKGAHKSHNIAVQLWGELNKHTPTWVALHARAATLGAPTNNNNNHPVNVGPIWLMHNGTIINHETVFKKLKRKRPAEVDTVAVAACLAYGGLEKVLELCTGSMSLVWSDTRKPKQLHLYTNGRSPLCTSIKDGQFVYASTRELLPLAFVPTSTEVPAGEHVVLEAGKKPLSLKAGLGKTIVEVPHQWNGYGVGYSGGVLSGIYECYDLDCETKGEHTHQLPTYTKFLHKRHTHE